MWVIYIARIMHDPTMIEKMMDGNANVSRIPWYPNIQTMKPRPPPTVTADSVKISCTRLVILRSFVSTVRGYLLKRYCKRHKITYCTVQIARVPYLDPRLHSPQRLLVRYLRLWIYTHCLSRHWFNKRLWNAMRVTHGWTSSGLEHF